MKRLLTMIFLVLSSGVASAEWVALNEQYQSPGLRTVYVDRATMHRDGNLMTLWQLVDFRLSQGDRGGFRHILSAKTQKQFSCADKRVRSLAYTEFSRHMGTGSRNVGTVGPGIWSSIEPDSINQALWEFACGTP